MFLLRLGDEPCLFHPKFIKLRSKPNNFGADINEISQYRACLQPFPACRNARLGGLREISVQCG
jgi:hypothetical protein